MDSKKHNSMIPEALLKEYQATIPKKLKSLQEKIEEVKRSPSETNWEALHFLVHKLAGSAGSYGYNDVSIACKSLELEIVKKVKDEKLLYLLDGYLLKIKRGFNE